MAKRNAPVSNKLKYLSTGAVTVILPSVVADFTTLTTAPTWVDSSSITGNRMFYDSTGKLTWSPANMLTNSAALSTQSVTVVNGVSYIVSFYGTGSITLSGAASATINGTGAGNRVYLKVTATTTTLTLTVSGSVTSAQLEAVTYQTTPGVYIATSASAIFQPRFDYNPSTLAARGLLTEESRQNLLTYSTQFDNAAWSKNAMSAFGSGSVADATTAPDGTQTADLLVPSATSAVHDCRQTPTLSAVAYTSTIYAKANGYNWIRGELSAALGVYFNLSNGSVGSSPTAGFTYSITNVGNGWYRCSVTYTPTAGSVAINWVITSADNTRSFTADGVSGIYVWGAQLETGAFATSFVPTTSSTVTRAADILKLSGSALTTMQASAFTAYAEATLYSTSNSGIIFGVGTAASLIYATGNTTANSYDSLSSPTTVGSTVAGSGSWLTTMRAGLATNSSGRSLVLNNGTVVSKTGALGTTRTAVSLSGYSNATQMANGWFRSVAFYDQKLSDPIFRARSNVGAIY